MIVGNGESVLITEDFGVSITWEVRQIASDQDFFHPIVSDRVRARVAGLEVPEDITDRPGGKGNVAVRSGRQGERWPEGTLRHCT